MSKKDAYLNNSYIFSKYEQSSNSNSSPSPLLSQITGSVPFAMFDDKNKFQTSTSSSYYVPKKKFILNNTNTYYNYNYNYNNNLNSLDGSINFKNDNNNFEGTLNFQ